MTDELENQLRRALRPVDAPAGFAERLMSRLPVTPAALETKAPVIVALPVPARRKPRNFALPAALAASLVAAVMLGQHMARELETGRQQRELAEGRAASRELMEALRVTSQKLDMAYQAVNSPSRPSAPGEEENPS
jgi:hypothetical protein